MVEHAADADRVPVLRHGVGHRGGPVALYGLHETEEDADRHALRGHHRQVSVLHLCDRFHPGNTGPDPPHLRERRELPQPGFHGAYAAVVLPRGPADWPGYADSAGASGSQSTLEIQRV